MGKRSKRRGQDFGHPPKIQEFVDWQRNQYMGAAYYHGRRVPPFAVMRAQLAGHAVIYGLLLAVVFEKFGVMKEVKYE